MKAAAAVRSPLAAILLLAILCAFQTVNSTYIESVAAKIDENDFSKVSDKDGKKNRQHESFVPMVAFQCGYKNKFIDENDGEWRDDSTDTTSCLQDKYTVLKYCQKVYPNKEITNIVEYSHLSHIEKWCKEGTENCKHQATVRPYRCIVGEFVTESLQVPSRCHFSHVAGKNKCNDYKYWNLKAESECGLKIEEETKQSMKLRSFSILEPCGLGMFRGVEYVCCPKSVEDKIEKVIDLQKDEDDDDDDDEEDEDEGRIYIVYNLFLEETDNKVSDNEKKNEEQDPYFKMEPNSNEHERFIDAEDRLEKKYRKKVTKVITEWSELFERYNKMKEKDPKGAEEYKREMTARFRKTVTAIEEENKAQRMQIEDVHDERVQTTLNEKKRQTTHDYRAALAIQVGTKNNKNVLKTLKNYIKAEEKDRTHMLNRYRHLLRVDPEAAISFEPVLLHRLRYIDLRINGTLAMLRDFPELEKEIRPIALRFWSSYRRENTPETHELNASEYIGDDKKNERLIRLYKQAYERNHPNSDIQLAFGNVKAQIDNAHKSHEPSTTTLATTTENKVISFKEKEDSDEDQFDDDSETSDSESSSQSKLTNEKETLQVKTTVTPYRIQIEQHQKKQQKDDLLKRQQTKTIKQKEIKDVEKEDENADDDDEEEEEDENEKVYFESKDNKKNKDENLNVAIEPIVSDTISIQEDMGEIPPSYAKHNMLVAYNSEFREQPSVTNLFTNFNTFVVALTAFGAVLLIIGVVFKRRNRHPGFVDVCTPEERHVNGMQVNGYENPTYTYFDSKA